MSEANRPTRSRDAARETPPVAARPLRNNARRSIRRRRALRRGFNLVEMLIALAIAAALLTATMVALDASFMAYQTTTEVASTHTIGRLAVHRILAMIRNGTEFGPYPLDPKDSIVESDFIEFRTPGGELMSIEWIDTDAVLQDEALYVYVEGVPYLLLEGVVAQVDPDTGQIIPPFTLEYELGRKLYRATLDLSIVPDDNMSVELDGENQQSIRLVASAMPRRTAYE